MSAFRLGLLLLRACRGLFLIWSYWFFLTMCTSSWLDCLEPGVDLAGVAVIGESGVSYLVRALGLRFTIFFF